MRRMGSMNMEDLPYMVYADEEGRVYDHPHYRMVGFSGGEARSFREDELLALPEFSKLFFIPKCPPIGLDPDTGEILVVPEISTGRGTTRCQAVAAFLEPGLVRTHLPAVDYGPKDYVLPMWAYTAVGFRGDNYWAAAYRIEYNHRWDPANYDDRTLIRAVEAYKKTHGTGPLVEHLTLCATVNHCFAAKNLFLKRWEAPLPVSRVCNARCLGCLSLQGEGVCEASHERLAFRPSQEEIVSIAVRHLEEAPDPIVSFGQGCEGEPLTESRLIEESIREMRRRTHRGTINLNTNGSLPDRVRALAESGLDSIRISLQSARPDFYEAYTRPVGYSFEDVVHSITLARKMGLYTMVNYLVFPGVSDQEAEMQALDDLIGRTGVNFLHLKNLNIDPDFYLRAMPRRDFPGRGMKQMAEHLRATHPTLELGYFNRAVR